MALKGNCIIGQSGGPTTVINASLSGVISQALKSENIQTVYGAVNGIEGVLSKRLVNFTAFADDDFLKALKHTPAAYLGSCRHKLPNLEGNTDTFNEIFKILKELNIKYFFYIGGNDSMDTVMKLSAYAKIINYPINIIGVPKTIDNDLKCTDHTPGYGSAAKFIASSVREIGYDSDVYDLDSVTIIEIMGRNAGWLAASAVLARDNQSSAPHLIYLPEVAFSDEQFISDINEVRKRGIRNIIVVVSEGTKYQDGTYICESAASGLTDVFGHKYLSGTAKVLENVVREKLGFKARGVEFNVLQRCAMHFASLTDLTEAEQIGNRAVIEAENGETGKMMIYVRTNNNPYTIDIQSYDINKIANGEKIIPREWINEAGNDVTQELIDYVQPLIIGQPELKYENGLPVYARMNK